MVCQLQLESSSSRHGLEHGEFGGAPAWYFPWTRSTRKSFANVMVG